jgi:LmbE family N-acetylglucosaminyl deacetylase
MRCVTDPRAGYCPSVDVSASPVDGSTNPVGLAPGWVDAMRAAAPWEPIDGPVLVVVPHPDDESLMFGGVLARCAGRGSSVHLLAVTDGEAAYPGIDDVESLARLRRTEQRKALSELGLGGATVTRLGIPDGRVAEHGDVLVDAIVEIADRERVVIVLAPWEHDHHTDHEACGHAATRARRRAAASFALVSGLFWSMLREPAPPGVALAALALTSGELAHKSAAIRRHRSQVDRIVSDVPVLGDRELAIGRMRAEYVIVERPA